MSEPKQIAEATSSYDVAKADSEIPTLTIAEQRRSIFVSVNVMFALAAATAQRLCDGEQRYNHCFDLRQVTDNTRLILLWGAWQPGTTCRSV